MTDSQGSTGRWWLHIGASVLIAATTMPFWVDIVSWWTHNDLSLVSFSLAMLPVTGAAVWVRLRRYPRPTRSISGGWAAALAAGLLAALCWVLGQPILGALGAWTALLALVSLWLGGAWGRFLAPALTPLWLVVPLTRDWPGVVEHQLQLVSAWLAALCLRVIGVPVLRVGEMLYTPTFWNRVDDTCSGVATITTLAVYALILGLLLRVRDGRLALAAVLAIPLGLFVNGARIASISVLGEEGGVDLAAGPMHAISGYVAFGVAYAALLALLWRMRGRDSAVRT